MIQFNLLPDVKKEYVKAKRTKRTIVSISILASGVAIGIVVLMYSFLQIAQERHIKGLTDDIQSATSEIKNTQDLVKILTVQNQLSLLSGEEGGSTLGLHAQKPKTSRLIDYVKFYSPKEVKVNSLNINIENSSIQISGTADAIKTVNKLVDNIKAVRYKIADSEETPIFVYSGVNTTLSGNDESATFDITMTYDPVIFDNTVEINMLLFPTDDDGNPLEPQVYTTIKEEQ